MCYNSCDGTVLSSAVVQIQPVTAQRSHPAANRSRYGRRQSERLLFQTECRNGELVGDADLSLCVGMKHISDTGEPGGVVHMQWRH